MSLGFDLLDEGKKVTMSIGAQESPKRTIGSQRQPLGRVNPCASRARLWVIGRLRRALRLSRLVVCTALLTACAKPPELIGVVNPDLPVGSVSGASLQKVFIATTREDSEVVGALFSDLRSDELGLASVTVSIPPTHQPGRLERPTSLPPDPRKEFAVVDPTVYDGDQAFIASLNRELALRGPNEREIMFFVHGYNTTASKAILRAAQFVEDTNFRGVPVLFTWASAGRLTEYVYDINSALIARPSLLETGHILDQTIATGYYIFAHSMGAF